MKNTMIEQGVTAGRISTIGMGSDSSWHTCDAGYDGLIASSNRNIVLIDISTDLAKKLMNDN